MDKVKVTQFSIVIPIQIGAISEKKKNKLDELLIQSGMFKNSIITQIGLVYISKLNDANLVINQDRIAYTKVGEEFDDNIKNSFNIVFENLMLDESINLSINIQGMSNCKDSHADSKQKFDLKFNNALLNCNSIYGVGYRFLIKNDIGLGEFKIEPLIADKTKYFYQYAVNIKERVKINDISKNVAKQMQYFINDLDKFANKLK